jgi:hypothetical protein
MKLTITLIAAVLAATAIGVVAYDRSSSHGDSPLMTSAAVHTAIAANVGGYRIEAAPQTVMSLARNRTGCTLTDAVPAQTVCDIAVAFPNVGADGTVTFVISTDVPTAGSGLRFDLGS